jgi:RNA polymerase sigma-B factor
MSFNEIKHYQLFKTYIEKDKPIDLRNEIFIEFNYLVDIIARKYLNKGIEYEDLYQVAAIGLIYAIERFDPDKGFEFSSFATPTILGEIKRHFRDKSWTLKIPRRIQELSKKIVLAKNHLQQTLQHTPTIYEIAVYLSVTEEAILEAMEASHLFNLKSLDVSQEVILEGGEYLLLDLLGEEDKKFQYFEDKNFVEWMMDRLNPLEREIINRRYIQNEQTQTQVATELNISQVAVSRIEKKVLEKMKLAYPK